MRAHLRVFPFSFCVYSFVIEYMKRDIGIEGGGAGGDDSWVLVNNNVKPAGVRDQADFLILDLGPETRYTLRMTAHNAADSTVSEYNFTTLTFAGGN